jgi:hypothetical protein
MASSASGARPARAHSNAAARLASVHALCACRHDGDPATVPPASATAAAFFPPGNLPMRRAATAAISRLPMQFHPFGALPAAVFLPTPPYPRTYVLHDAPPTCIPGVHRGCSACVRMSSTHFRTKFERRCTPSSREDEFYVVLYTYVHMYERDSST